MPYPYPAKGKLDKSSLTGESEPVLLSAKCTDRNHFETRNLAFLGTLLTEGTVTGLVVATGQETMMGRLGLGLGFGLGLGLELGLGDDN